MSILDRVKKSGLKPVKNKKIVEKETINLPSKPTARVLMKTVVSRPHVSEKAYNGAALNQYTFQVKPGVTKNEIKQAIQNEYNVTVIKVNTITKRQKDGRWYNRIKTGRLVKRATVTLKKGDKLDIIQSA